MKLFKRKSNLSEITQYVDDLKEFTILRDEAEAPEEIERYDQIIKVMQLVILELTDTTK